DGLLRLGRLDPIGPVKRMRYVELRHVGRPLDDREAEFADIDLHQRICRFVVTPRHVRAQHLGIELGRAIQILDVEAAVAYPGDVLAKSLLVHGLLSFVKRAAVRDLRQVATLKSYSAAVLAARTRRQKLAPSSWSSM